MPTLPGKQIRDATISVDKLTEDVINQFTPPEASDANASDITTSSQPGTSDDYSRADHTHQGLHSIKIDGGLLRYGNIILKAGTGITLSEPVGNTIQISGDNGSQITDGHHTLAISNATVPERALLTLTNGDSTEEATLALVDNGELVITNENGDISVVSASVLTLTGDDGILLESDTSMASGSHLLPTLSGGSNLGSALLPFGTIYTTILAIDNQSMTVDGGRFMHGAETLAYISEIENLTTDLTGTTNLFFQIDSDADGPRVQNNSGILDIKNHDGSAYADFHGNNLTLEGDMNIKGNLNYIDTQTLQVEDTHIRLNREYTGIYSAAPKSGLEIETGSDGIGGDQPHGLFQYDAANLQWELVDSDGIRSRLLSGSINIWDESVSDLMRLEVSGAEGSLLQVKDYDGGETYIWGRLGIGTNTPTAALHVNGPTLFADAIGYQAGDARGLYVNKGTSNSGFRMGNYDGDPDSDTIHLTYGDPSENWAKLKLSDLTATVSVTAASVYGTTLYYNGTDINTLYSPVDHVHHKIVSEAQPDLIYADIVSNSGSELRIHRNESDYIAIRESNTGEINFLNGVGDSYLRVESAKTNVDFFGNLTAAGTLAVGGDFTPMTTIHGQGDAPGIFLSTPTMSHMFIMYVDTSMDTILLGSYSAHPMMFMTVGQSRLEIGTNGNIGVAKSPSTYKFDVNGSLNATSLYYNGTDINDLIGGIATDRITADETHEAIISNNGGSSELFIECAVEEGVTFIVDESTNLAVTSTGGGYIQLEASVGIGRVPDTSYSLDALGAVRGSYFYSNSMVMHGSYGLYISNYNRGRYHFGAETDGGAYPLELSSGNETYDDGHIAFNVAGAEVGRFTADGRLGIGTDTPSAALHVVGAVWATSYIYTQSDVQTPLIQSAASNAVLNMQTKAFTQSSGDNDVVRIAPDITQTDAAGYKVLHVDVTETSVGAGGQYLAYFNIGAAPKMVLTSDCELGLNVDPLTTLHVKRGNGIDESITNVYGAIIESDQASSHTDLALKVATLGESNALVVTTSGRTGIGTQTPEYDLQVIGQVYAQHSGEAFITNGWFSAGTAGNGLYSDRANALSIRNNNASGYVDIRTGGDNPRVTITNNGSVGIGITDPDTNLHVIGDVLASNRLNVADNTIYGQGAVLTITSGQGLELYTRNGDGDYNRHQVYLEPEDGFVGINTSEPTHNLHVKGTSIITNDTTAYLYIMDTTKWLSSNGDWLELRNTEAGQSVSISSADAISMNAGRATGVGNIVFNVNSNEAMRITQDKYVGIGTDSPSVKLDVVGAIRTDTYLSTPVVTSSGDLVISTATDSAGRILLMPDGAAAVGIGTMNPSAKLEIVGEILINANNDEGLYFNGDGGIVRYGNGVSLQRAGTNVLTVSSVANKVGIGTDSPDYALDVVGDIGVDEYIYHNDDVNTYLQFLTDRVVLSAGNHTVLDYTEGTASTFAIGYGGQADITIGYGSGAIIFQGGTEGSYAGKVGIGTSTPSDTLDVIGNTKVQGIMTIDRGSDAYVTNMSILAGSDHHSAFQFSTNTPDSLMVLNSRSGYDMGFFINDVEKMRIKTSGRVGIGTEAPVSLLEVAGTVTAERFETSSTTKYTTTISGVFTTDAKRNLVFDKVFVAGENLYTGTVRMTMRKLDTNSSPNGIITKSFAFSVVDAAVSGLASEINEVLSPMHNYVRIGEPFIDTDMYLKIPIYTDGMGSSRNLNVDVEIEGSSAWVDKLAAVSFGDAEGYVFPGASYRSYSHRLGIALGNDTMPEEALHLIGDIQLHNTYGIKAKSAGGTPYRFIEAKSDDKIYLRANSTSASHLVIDNSIVEGNSGRIGINTAEPTGDLQIGSISSSNNVLVDVSLNDVLNVRWNEDSRVLLSANAYGSFGTEYGINGSGGIRLGGDSDYSYIVGSGTDLLLNPIAGNVGIGTASPNTQMHIYADSEELIAMKIETSGYWDVGEVSNSYGLYVDHNRGPYNNGGIRHGVFSRVRDYTGSQNSTRGLTTQLECTSGYSAQNIGVHNIIQHTDTTYAFASGSMYGVKNELSLFDGGNSGSYSNAFGIHSSLSISLNRTLNNYYGLYLASKTGSGALPTVYYGIYQQDSNADNYLAGSLGIGVATPQAVLDVKTTGKILLGTGGGSVTEGLVEIDATANTLTLKNSSDDNGLKLTGGATPSISSNGAVPLNMVSADDLTLDAGAASDILFRINNGEGSYTPRMTLSSDSKLTLALGTGINEFSTDHTLSGNSDDAVPTEKAVKTYVDAAVIAAPAPPTDMLLSQVGDHINVQFSASETSGDLSYEIWSSVGNETSFGLIGLIPPEDVTATMVVVDSTYDRKATIYYRVYALVNGCRSTALTGSLTATNDVAEVSNLTIDDFVEFYAVQFTRPVDRRLSHIEIKVDAQADAGDLLESNAVLVYSGLTESYIYKVKEADKDKYHQFWVYTITRS